MLQYVQALQYTPACRAGTFFAGVGLLTSQVFVNMTQVSICHLALFHKANAVTQNGVSSAMDITALLPRYIDIRRGGFVIVVIGIVIQPWRFLTQAATFLTVLSSFGGKLPQLITRSSHILTRNSLPGAIVRDRLRGLLVCETAAVVSAVISRL